MTSEERRKITQKRFSLSLTLNAYQSTIVIFQCFYLRQTMKSFKTTLSFFKEKETMSLHKFVLQKMSSQVAAERQKAIKSRNGGGLRKKPTPVACISMHLYESPVSLNTKMTTTLNTFNFTATKRLLSVAIFLQHRPRFSGLSLEIRLRSVHDHLLRLLHDQVGENARLLCATRHEHR